MDLEEDKTVENKSVIAIHNRFKVFLFQSYAKVTFMVK